MYNVNIEGRKRDEYVKKEAMKMLILGPLFSVIYISLFYLSMSDHVILFWAFCSLLILLTLLLFVFAPLLMVSRHNKTVKGIDFMNNTIIIETFPILCKKQELVNIEKSDMKIIKKVFSWYGKPSKEGYVLRSLKTQKEYYLIKDYFSEYNLIEKQINSKKY